MTPSPAWYAETQERLYRLVDRQLCYFEERLRPPLEVLDNAQGAALLRRAADLIGLWRVCEKSACRRGRRCRRDGGRCLARFAPLVPPQLGAQVMAKLREEHGLPQRPLPSPRRLRDSRFPSPACGGGLGRGPFRAA
jgi:hypothetical protein